MCGIALLVGTSALSQNLFDASRANRTLGVSTARSSAMGGAMGALGYDFSVSGTNPGGMALYNKSEVVLTSALEFSNQSTNHNGFITKDANSRFKLHNFGLVFSNENSNPTSGFVSSNWYFGFNQLMNFQRNVSVNAPVENFSFLDPYTDQLNFNQVDPQAIYDDPSLSFGPSLAWTTYLINYDTIENEYFNSNFFLEGNRKFTSRQSGAMADYTLGYATNFEDELYLSANISLTTFRFEQKLDYAENIGENPQFTDLDNFKYATELNMSGSSLKLRLGAVYRINDMFRAGLAYHTGSRILIDETIQTFMISNFIDGDSYSTESLKTPFAYRLRQPARLIASGAFLLNKTLSIAGDYEVVDYRKSRILKADGGLYDYDFENREISDSMKVGHNIRVGAEYRVTPFFSVRGGARYIDRTLRNKDYANSYWIFSGGGGFRTANFFADLAVMWWRQSEQSWMFNPNYITANNTTQTRLNISLSIGLRW